MPEKDKNCLYFMRTTTNYTNGNNGPKNVVCPKNESFRFTCVGSVDNENIMNLIFEPSVNDDKFTQYPQFWYLFAALSLSWIAMAVIVSVGDAICFHLLGKRHELYGNQRLWGAIGWGSFALIAGVWVDFTSEQKTYKNFTVIFYLMAVALLPDTFVSSYLEVSEHL